MKQRRADYTEPHLILLDDLSPGGDIHDHLPEGCRDIARDLYIRRRHELSQLIGGLELAWRRGYQAGQEDALGVPARETAPKTPIASGPGSDIVQGDD